MTSPAFYNGLARVAQDLINKFGGPAVIRRAGQSTYDPATGQATPPAPIDFPVQACVFDYPDAVVNGTLIQAGDKQVYLGAVGFDAPLLSDYFVTISDSFAYTIVKVKPLAPGGIQLLFELQVRR